MPEAKTATQAVAIEILVAMQNASCEGYEMFKLCGNGALMGRKPTGEEKMFLVKYPVVQ